MRNIFKHIFGLSLIIFLTNAPVFAQPSWQWVNSGGGNSWDQVYLHSIATDSLGNNYYTGFFTGSATIAGTSLTATGGSSDQDIFVAKYDKNGTGIWAKSVGGTGNDIGRGIGLDNSLNIYVTGYYYSSSITFNGTTVNNAGASLRDAVVFKYNANGTASWIKSFGSTGDDTGGDIAVTSAGNCYFSGGFSGTVAFGGTNLTSNGGLDVYVSKLNSSGTVQWAKGGGGSSGDNQTEIRLDNSENVYLTGYVQGTATFGSLSATSAGGVDIFVIKYTSSGTETWLKLAGGTLNDSGLGIGVSSNGNVNISGYYQGTATFGSLGSLTSAGGQDIFVLQYNSSGTPLWVHSVGSTSTDLGNDLVVDANNNIYVTGYFTGTVTFGSLSSLTSAGGQDIFVAKYNDAGTALFSLKAGGTSDDQGDDIIVDVSNRIFIAGTYQGTATFGSTNKTSAGNLDVYFASLTVTDLAQPNWKWVNSGGGSSWDQVYLHSVATDSLGNNYYTGFFTGSATIAGTSLTATGGSSDQDIFVAKYDKDGNGLWAASVGGTGNDIGRGIGLDNSLNIYVTGYYYSSSITFNGTTVNNAGGGVRDVVVLKYNANGTANWIKGFGSTGDDAACDIAVTTAGNCYFSGDFAGTVAFGSTNLTSNGGLDIFVSKLNSSGTVQWAKGGGGSSGDNNSELRIDNSENVYLTGYVRGTATFGSLSATSAGGADIFALKYTSSGTETWLKLAGGTSDDSGNGLAISSSGNVNICGYFQGTATFGSLGSLTSAGGQDIFVLQYNSSGTPVWVHSVGSTSTDVGNDLGIDENNNIYATGYFTGTVTFGSLSSLASAGGQDIFLAKYNDGGTALFSVKAGGTSDDQGDDILVDASNRIFIAGTYQGTANFGSTSKSSAGNLDVYFACLNVNSINYTWTGTTSIAWETATNWSPNGVPGGADDITIGNVANPPMLSRNFTVNKLTMTGGALTAGTAILTVADTSVFNGGSIYCTVISLGTIATFAGTTFDVPYTANCANIYLNGSTFDSTTNITKTGSALNISTGGNTFNNSATITNSGSGEMRLAGTNIDTYNGAMTFTKSGSGALKVAYAGINLFYGDVTASGVTFGDNGGTVSFEGSNSQSLSGASINISKLRMNKLNLSALTIYSPVTVTTSLTMNTGNIILSGGSAGFTANDNVTLTGGSGLSFIDGAVTKVGNDAFTFPLGNGITYMPLAITAPTNTTDAFQAQAFASTPANPNNFDATIKSLIPAYWNLARTVGSSSVQTTLYWNSSTPKPIFPDAAHVAEMVGSQWQDKGSNTLTFSYLQGSVTSNALTAYGNITLGFTTTNPGTCSTCDTLMNWVTVRRFDEYGRVADDKKIFSDNLGRAKQSQQRNLVANKILTQANVYDTYGRLGLSTLPAPITDSTCFAYHSDFIKNSSNVAYGHKDFDSTNTLNNPSSVYASCFLGSYYNNSNNYEAYVATSGHPFSSTDYNDLVIGGVTRSSGPADSLSMGKGHETRSITLPVYGELSHYYTIKNSYFISSAGSSLDGQVLKVVTKDQNGTEGIIYKNKSGQTIAACLASTTDSLNVSVNLYAKFSSYTLKVPASTRLANILIESAGNVEIYRYSTSTNWYGAASSNPYLSLSAGDSIRIYCNTPFAVAYGIYTTVSGVEYYSKNKIFSNNINNLNNSVDLHLQKGHHLSLTQSSGTCSVSVINLETGSSVYSGTVSSFTSSSSIAPGFYRITFTGESTNTNSATGTYVTVSYYNKYGNYTYSYYDNAGRLLGQTAPNGVVRSSSSNPNYTSTYTYNTLSWTLTTKDPDRGLTYYVYQKDGSLRFSQDSLQRANNRFSYINYDNLKRVTETGEYTSRASQTPNDLYFQNMKSNYQGASIPSGYSNIFTVLETNSSAICNGNCNTVSDLAYDTPDGALSGIASGYTQRNVNGKTSKSSNGNITSWYSYDERGRVEWTVQQLTGTTTGTAGGDFSSTASDRVKTLDYAYDISSHLLQTIFQKNVNGERLDHFYTYDQMQRLKKVQTSLSGGVLVEHAEYLYYLHGPLKRTELGDTLQGLDYVYTIDGMLKAINHPYLDTSDVGKDSYSGAHSHFGKDIFGMMLEYYDNDYVRGARFQTTANLTSSGYSNYFNGNVRSWTWNQSACTTGTALAQYSYKYDAKYQLIEADFGTHSTSTNQYTASGSSIYKVYGITYDKNGGLLTLRRNDQSGSTASKDYINYVYNTNQNSLQKTQNSVPSDTRNYTYDVTGRTVSCTNSLGANPNYLSYDYSGKVTGVYKDASKTQPLATFLYDEKGHRIRKTQYNSSSPYNATAHIYYVSDAQGTVLSVYSVTVGSSAVQEEIYIYGKSRIGLVNKYGTSNYEYEIKDHLGNVRANFWKNTTTHLLEVVSYSDYYPHGGVLPGRNLIPSNNPRNNCYQGEYAERDDETGYVNFDLRMYDADVATWHVTDPMYQDFSPYMAMGNNPMAFIDPTGGKKWQPHTIAGKVLKFTVTKVLPVAAIVVVGVVTDGIGDAFLAPAFEDAFVSAGIEAEAAATAGEITAGVLTGAFTGAVGGGIQYSANTDHFEWHDFWSNVGVGAIGGAVAGGVDGAFEEVSEGATMSEFIRKGAIKGLASGSAGGFAFGFSKGVAHGGYSFGQDLEMGLTGALTGGAFGAIAGAGEGLLGGLRARSGKMAGDNRLIKQVQNRGVRRAYKASRGANGGGAFEKVTLGRLFNANYYRGNVGGKTGNELIENLSDQLFGDGLNSTLNSKIWGIKEENSDDNP
jgi:RHS repeat-associated protein